MNTEPTRQALDIQLLKRAISRHRLLVVFVFLAFTGLVSFNSLTKPTLYNSSAILFFDNSSNSQLLDLLGKTQELQVFDIGYYGVILTTNLFEERFRQEVRESLSKTKDASYVESAMTQVSSSAINLKSYKESSQFFELSATSNDTFLVRKLIEVATDLLRRRAQEIDQEGLQKGIKFIEEQIEITKSNLEKTELSLQAKKKKMEMTSGESEPLNRVILMSDKLAELETQIQIRLSNFRTLSTQLDSIQRKMSGERKTGNGTATSQEEDILKLKIEDLQSRKVAIFERLGENAKSSLEVKQIDDELENVRNKYYNLLSSVKSSEEPIGPGNSLDLWKQVFSKKNEEELELLLLRGQARLYRGLVENFESRNPNLLEDAIDFTRLNRSKQVYEETLSSLIKQREGFSIQFYGTSSKLKVIDPAKRPQAVYNKVFTNIFVGAILGLLIGVAMAMGVDFIDTTIKSAETLATVTALPIIGKVPVINIDEPLVEPKTHGKKMFFKNKKAAVEVEDKNLMRKKAMISQFNSRSFISERYRALRTNIQFANIDTPLRSILIGSAGPGEGKTTTAVNLAISFADMGQTVCLVDSDLRKPKHHILFEVAESPGLVDVVLNNASVDQAIQVSSITNLSLMTVGSDALFHSEVFSSIRMSFLMNELEKRFDVVIYDAPPVLLLTDSVILSSRVDGVILVVKYGLTQKNNLHNALEALKSVRANLVGIVMNQFAGEQSTSYEYAYDSYYRFAPEQGRPTSKYVKR